MDVCQAIAYAHSRGVIHRDLKPRNLVLTVEDDGSVLAQIVDFGIAKVIETDVDQSNTITQTGEVFGSPLYMSPEQLMGKKVSGRSDVYSLGATFYQLTTGVAPFDGDSLAALTYKIINQKHPALKTLRADIPSSTIRVINKALQKDPEKRFESALSMAQTLKKVILKQHNCIAKRWMKTTFLMTSFHLKHS